MSIEHIHLPNSLYQAAREAAEQDGISVNQLIASALGEKIAALKTVEYLRECGQNADESDLAAVLDMVPNAEPEPHDRLP